MFMDGIFAHAEASCNLRRGQAFDPDQQEDTPPHGRHPLHGSFEKGNPFAADHDPFRRRFVRPVGDMLEVRIVEVTPRVPYGVNNPGREASIRPW